MGFLSTLATNPILFFIVAGIIIVALTIHEFAHAWVADKLGDPTPRYQGRVTLNPLAHLDLFGTVLLFVVGFGWGKPVETDPHNLQHPIRDMAIIAAAGPLSNLLFAAVLVVVFSLGHAAGVIPLEWLQAILPLAIFYNCMLAIFNLVPVHPLDGSKVLMAALPRSLALEYEELMHRYGMFILIALIFPWTSAGSPVTYIITPVISVVVSFYLHALQLLLTTF